MSDQLTSRIVSPLDLAPEELSAWERICLNTSGLQSPFFSPHFARAVAMVRPGVHVCVLRSADRPVGFLPFQYATPWSEWFEAAEPVGGAMNDYFGLIAESGVQVSVREILRWTGLSHIAFTCLDEDQLDFGLHGEQPEPALRIRLAQDGRAQWEQLPSSKRRFMKRGSRLEAEHGPLRFLWSEADRGFLENLLHVKRRQYVATGVPDALAEEWRRKLIHNLAGSNQPTCAGVLSVLYAGDTWVASHFGLRSVSVLHYWFPVYNPDLREFAPGRLLIKHMCEAAAAQGIRCLDLGRGESQAKRDTGNERHVFYRGAWSRPGPKSTIVRAMNSLQWRFGAMAAGKPNQLASSPERLP